MMDRKISWKEILVIGILLVIALSLIIMPLTMKLAFGKKSDKFINIPINITMPDNKEDNDSKDDNTTDVPQKPIQNITVIVKPNEGNNNNQNNNQNDNDNKDDQDNDNNNDDQNNNDNNDNQDNDNNNDDQNNNDNNDDQDNDNKDDQDNNDNKEDNTPDLAKELLKQYAQGNTKGLLKSNNGYYYKGTNEEVANNYVWFGGHLWRVISIDNNNNITMITQQPITAISPAYDVWETEHEYKNSYVNYWLNNVFLNSMSEVDKSKIQMNTFNIGHSQNIFSAVTRQRVGLLDELQYIKAGTKTSFLDIDEYFWLGNKWYTYVSHSFYGQLNGSGWGSTANALGVRPVIKISSFEFTSGDGTLSNPYREKSATTSTNNIKVGEYVSVPTTGTDCGSDNRCLFRVVSKDSNSIKVILNGLLPNTSVFDEEQNAIYSNAATINTALTSFANTISGKYRYTGIKLFYTGNYLNAAGYLETQKKSYSGNVGLPSIGDMFSGNDIDVSTSPTKTFVNAATIENARVSDSFWTMNGGNTSSTIRYISSAGALHNTDASRQYGVRPVLFLNKDLIFTGGEGTAERPYILK